MSRELYYTPDLRNSSVSSKASVPGYKIDGFNSEIGLATYETTFGDPRLADTNQSVYSQYNFNILISRPGWGFFFKIFEGLFIAIAVSMIGFFVRPIHSSPRFLLGVGALFAAVANYYTIHSMQSDIEIMTLADKINFIGIFTIFLMIIESTIALYLYDSRGLKELSQQFDRVSALIFIISYISLNALILMALNNISIKI